jgi:hypothetical protein
MYKILKTFHPAGFEPGIFCSVGGRDGHYATSPGLFSRFYNIHFQGDEVLYGTADGKIGLVQLSRQGPHTHWLLEPEATSANGAVTSGAVQGPML